MSMKSSSSANATMSSYFSARWSRVRPEARPPRTTFSRPLSLRLNPTPSDSSVLTRPSTSMRPDVGGRMPAIVRTSVDLPAPLAPTTPSTLPCSTSNDTCWSASISRTIRCRRPSRLIVSVSVGFFSNDVRYVTDTSCTEMQTRSDADSELTLPGEEEQPAGDEQPHPPGQGAPDAAQRRRLALGDDIAPGPEQQPDRVRLHDPLVAVGNLRVVVEDRRDVEPDPQDVGQEVVEVAEVDLTSCEDHRQPRRGEAQDADDRDRPQQPPADRPLRDDVDRDVDQQRGQEPEERGAH